MKKRILVIYLTLIALFAFCCAFVGCKTNQNQDEQEEPELTQISVAGYFELTSPIRYSSTMAVTRWEFDFYNDGSVKQYLVGMNNGNISMQTIYGKYVCYEEIDGLFVLWEGGSYPDDVKTFTYDGVTINNGLATFKLCAKNDRGEFSGKAMRVEYETDLGGKIVGESIQYLKKGDNCSSVTATPSYGYLFSGWSDGVTSPTRQDIEITKNFSVRAIFTTLPNTHNDFTAFVYYDGQKVLDSYNESFGEYYNCTFEVLNQEETYWFFEQSEYRWYINFTEINSALVFKFESISSDSTDTEETFYMLYAIKLNKESIDYKIEYNDSLGALYQITLQRYENDHTIFYIDQSI